MTMELSGETLRAAARTLAQGGDDDALGEATGLPLEAMPRLRKAIELAGSRLERVERAVIHEADDLTGQGTLCDGLEYVLALRDEPPPPGERKLVRGRRKRLPDLVRVVHKGDRPALVTDVAPVAAAETKPAWPSSPPKRDLPIGRGLFSSAGKRESPRPGVVPVPLTPKPRPAAPAKPRAHGKPMSARPAAPRSERAKRRSPAGAKGRPFGGEKKPFGKRPLGKKPFGQKPFGKKPFGKRPPGGSFNKGRGRPGPRR
jgi:hypothetical protein